MTYIPVALNADKRPNIALPIELQNWYARPVPADGASLTRADLLPTPGMTERLDLEATIDGIYQEDGVRNGLLHVSAGGKLYGVDSAWSETEIGTIASGQAEFTGLRDRLFVAANTRLWRWNGSSLTEVTDVDLPDVETLTVLNQRLVVSEPDADTITWSATLDGTDIDSLAFTTAEQGPDEIRRIARLSGQFIAMGSSSLEVFRPVPDTDLPFRNINNQAIEETSGLLGKNAVARSGDKLFFVGGNLSNYYMAGFSVAPVPTNRELEDALKGLSVANQQATRCFAYRDGTHEHLIVKPSTGRAFVHDRSTGLWHTRTTGLLGYYAPNYHARAYGKEIVAFGNKLYTLEDDVYAEADGSEIIRKATFKINTRRHDTIGTLAFDIQTYGHPQTGQGVSPQMIVSISTDGRVVPSADWPSYHLDIPPQGEYWKPTIHGIGPITPAEGLTVHVSITDPIGCSIAGMWVNEVPN